MWTGNGRRPHVPETPPATTRRPTYSREPAQQTQDIVLGAETLAAALAVVTDLGLPVFPCYADKRPACPHGVKDATRDPAAIRDLWRRHPGALIGAPTGTVSGIDVLDVDPRHGGHLWLTAHANRLPITRTHGTQSGGWHILFACDGRVRNSAGKIAPGIDVRATGGYVIWWPAAGLAVEHPDALAPWPDWLLAKLVPPPARSQTPLSAPVTADRYARAAIKSACDRIRSAPVGQRNNTLNQEAFSLARLVMAGVIGEQDLADTLAEAAALAGLPPREIAATLASAFGARGAA